MNSHPKALQSEQKELAQEHNRISSEYEELNQLKINMDKYMKRGVEPKKSIRDSLKVVEAQEQNTKRRKIKKKEIEIG